MAALCIATAAHADTLLSESFTAGERLTQNLPDTVAWYTAYASSGISDSSGDLVSADNRHTLAYFTDAGAPVELGENDSLTLTFSFSLDTPAAVYTGFRIGLFDSQNNRIAADNMGSSAAAFSNYTGYAAFLHIQQGSAMQFHKRTGGLSSKLIHASDPFTALTGSLGTGTTFVSGQEYTGTLTLLRTASGMKMSCSVAGEDGYSAEYTDISAPSATFDTLVFYGAGSAVDGYTLTNVEITHTDFSGTLLLNETFVAGERLTENLPDTAAWYTAYASTAISDSTGDLVSSENRHIFAYFTESGSPQSLEVGESLTADMVFSLDTPAASTGGFRIGLFNSGGTRVATDNAGFSNDGFIDYTGYASFLNLQAASAMRLKQRTAGIGGKLINSDDSFTDLTGSMGTGTNFVSGQSYRLLLSVERIESGMVISAAIDGVDGYAATVTNTSAKIETAFDTLVVFGSSTALDGFTLTSVTISASSQAVELSAFPIEAQTTGSDTVISWEAIDGATYVLQRSFDLTDGSWSNIIEGISGAGPLSITNSSTEPVAFYRIAAQ
jgi:hypothetical protein